MIYLSDSSTLIPKISYKEANKIKFIHQVTKKEYEFDITDNGKYYILDSVDLPDGQYDYFINNEIESGIAQSGNYSRQKTDYTTDIYIKTYK